MTLLGSGAGFSSGVASPSSSSDPTTLFMALDDVIASRRRQGKQPEKAKSPATGLAKTVSNKDKAIATTRAKRSAALDARRGIAKSSKPSRAKVDQEINKQLAKTVAKQTAHQKKHANVFDPSAKAALRRQKRDLARSGTAVVVDSHGKNKKKNAAGSPAAAFAGTLGRPPSKKALRAAVTAMEEKGFAVPEGYRMVISFAPKEGGGADASMGMTAAPTNNKSNKNGKPAAKGGNSKKPSSGKKGGGKK